MKIYNKIMVSKVQLNILQFLISLIKMGFFMKGYLNLDYLIFQNLTRSMFFKGQFHIVNL